MNRSVGINVLEHDHGRIPIEKISWLLSANDLTEHAITFHLYPFSPLQRIPLSGPVSDD